MNDYASHCLYTCVFGVIYRGIPLTGPFVIMIYKMCASDMVRFVIIFVVFLIQFSQGTHIFNNFNIMHDFLRNDHVMDKVFICGPYSVI